jgi:prepilin-type N-terminal cleavage/methylation domain-containing protein
MSRRRQAGFTLLEVMIAMTILALALAALMGHESVAVQMSDYSNRVSQANLLAYGKLLDLEHSVIKDGMDSLDNCDEGDFRDEGFRDFRWKACAYKLEIEDGATEQIADQVISGLSGTFGINISDPSSLSADQQRQIGQLQQGIAAIPFFLQKLEDKVRKIRLEITWRDMLEDRVLIVERFVTILGAHVGGKAPPADGKAEPVAPSAVDL